MPVLEPINSVAYRIRVGRDTIELGDISAPQVRGLLKYNRNRGTYFKLGKSGTPTGLATVDAPNGVIRIPYSNEVVELTAHEPDTEYPDGRAEFNVIINAQPTPDVNGDYWQVLDFETSGFNLERLLGLDEEYDQAKCVENWGEDYPGTFTITPTEIRAQDGTLLKSKADHVVHSVLGTAIQNNHDKSIIGKNNNNGQDISYVRVSRDHLRLHRRLLVDNRGKTARIEDIQIVGNQLKFKLPKAFIEAGSTKYPIQHTTGVDPAYTQDWDNWATDTYGSDSTWSDYDLYTNKSVPKGAVAEIIMAQVTAGTENTLGVRTDGSSEAYRYVNIHEAEGGGETHCRMFAVCHATTGLIETYCSDVSDAHIFYLVGYWQNVSFTERWDVEEATASKNWTDTILALSDMANKVCHMICHNNSNYEDITGTIGVRAKGSALVRSLLLHEQESGGVTAIDFMVKADSNYTIESYISSTQAMFIYNAGYFGTELDFVENWQAISPTNTLWQTYDLSAYLDQDGRHCDFMITHSDSVNAGAWFGIRDGDDATTNRALEEHEAEGVGGDGTEFTGFSMSAKSNASGLVYTRVPFLDYDNIMLTGYFKQSYNQYVRDQDKPLLGMLSTGIKLLNSKISAKPLLGLSSVKGISLRMSPITSFLGLISGFAKCRLKEITASIGLLSNKFTAKIKNIIAAMSLISINYLIIRKNILSLLGIISFQTKRVQLYYSPLLLGLKPTSMKLISKTIVSSLLGLLSDRAFQYWPKEKIAEVVAYLGLLSGRIKSQSRIIEVLSGIKSLVLKGISKTPLLLLSGLISIIVKTKGMLFLLSLGLLPKKTMSLFRTIGIQLGLVTTRFKGALISLMTGIVIFVGTQFIGTGGSPIGKISIVNKVTGKLLSVVLGLFPDWAYEKWISSHQYYQYPQALLGITGIIMKGFGSSLLALLGLISDRIKYFATTLLTTEGLSLILNKGKSQLIDVLLGLKSDMLRVSGYFKDLSIKLGLLAPFEKLLKFTRLLSTPLGLSAIQVAGFSRVIINILELLPLYTKGSVTTFKVFLGLLPLRMLSLWRNVTALLGLISTNEKVASLIREFTGVLIGLVSSREKVFNSIKIFKLALDMMPELIKGSSIFVLSKLGLLGAFSKGSLTEFKALLGLLSVQSKMFATLISSRIGIIAVKITGLSRSIAANVGLSSSFFKSRIKEFIGLIEVLAKQTQSIFIQRVFEPLLGLWLKFEYSGARIIFLEITLGLKAVHSIQIALAKIIGVGVGILATASRGFIRNVSTLLGEVAEYSYNKFTAYFEEFGALLGIAVNKLNAFGRALFSNLGLISLHEILTGVKIAINALMGLAPLNRLGISITFLIRIGLRFPHKFYAFFESIGASIGLYILQSRTLSSSRILDLVMGLLPAVNKRFAHVVQITMGLMSSLFFGLSRMILSGIGLAALRIKFFSRIFQLSEGLSINKIFVISKQIFSSISLLVLNRLSLSRTAKTMVGLSANIIKGFDKLFAALLGLVVARAKLPARIFTAAIGLAINRTFGLSRVLQSLIGTISSFIWEYTQPGAYKKTLTTAIEFIAIKTFYLTRNITVMLGLLSSFYQLWWRYLLDRMKKTLSFTRKIYTSDFIKTHKSLKFWMWRQ